MPGASSLASSCSPSPIPTPSSSRSGCPHAISASSPSGWTHLPSDLLIPIARFASFGTLLHLALVHRRLHQLVLQPPSSDASYQSMWSRAAASFTVIEESSGYHVDPRQTRAVRVGSDQIECAQSDFGRVLSLLSVLRHVPALQIGLVKRELQPGLEYAKSDTLASLFPSLEHFTRLRQLALVGMDGGEGANELVDALEALPLLSSLELSPQHKLYNARLTATLQQLCSGQLRHLSLPQQQLHWFTFSFERQHMLARREQRTFVMPRYALPSLHVSHAVDVTRGPHLYSDDLHASLFPQLLHFGVDSRYSQILTTRFALPPLHSLTVVGLTTAELSHIATRAFCLRSEPDDQQPNYRRGARTMLTHSPRSAQQLSISDGSRRWADSDCRTSILPHTSATAAAPLSLTYFDFLRGMQLADLIRLLDPVSPPVCAQTLTHLALRVRWQDRTDAASWLPRLPSLYPALTHVHIGVEDERGVGWRTRVLQWDAALRDVRTALGAVWCDEAADVLCHREDVAWRRSVGLAKEW